MLALPAHGNLDIPLRALLFRQSLFCVLVSPVPAWVDSGYLLVRQVEAFPRFQVFYVVMDLGSWDDSRPCSACRLRSTGNSTYLETAFVRGFRILFLMGDGIRRCFRFKCCAWFDSLHNGCVSHEGFLQKLNFFLCGDGLDLGS